MRMRGLTIYVLKQLVTGMILVTIGLSILLWLSQSLRFVDLIVNKGLSLALFLKLTSLLLPGFLMVILPITMFVVVLFVVNKLTGDRELVVMRAVGMSQWDLSVPSVVLAGAVTLLSFALTVWIAPESVRDFRELQWAIRQDVTHLVLREGEFTDVGDNLVVFVAERSADNVLSGVMISDTHDPRKEVLIMAERGALVAGADVPRIHLVNGNRQEYSTADHKFSILNFDSYTAEFGDRHSQDDVRFRDARERDLTELFTAEAVPPLKETDIRRFRVEGVQRLLLPLQVLGMTMLALAGLLGGGFNRRGQGLRIAVTIALMIAFQGASLGLNALCGRSLLFLPLMPILTFLPIAIPAYLLYVRDRGPQSAAGTSAGVRRS